MKTSVHYLVLWWHTTDPKAAIFEDEIAAGAAAAVRNGVLLEMQGDVKISSAVDYYRRDDKGLPMPFAFQDLKETPHHYD